MHSEKENITQHPANKLPLPPPAHFDLEHLASAKPVKPLSLWQKSVGALQRIFGPHVIVVAVMVAGSVIGFTAATSAIDVASPAEPVTANDAVASSSRHPAEEATVAGEVEPATPDINMPDMNPPVQRRLTRQAPRIRRTAPPINVRYGNHSFEIDDDVADQKPRPRLVTIIH